MVTGRISLHVAGVLADFRGGQRGLVEDLADPLADGDRRGGQDQGRGLQTGERAQADDRLARAARQHDDAAAAARRTARIEDIDRFALVFAQPERQAVRGRVADVNSERRAFLVAGQVLDRVADLHQRLLQVAALGRVDDERVVVDAPEQVGLRFLVARDLSDEHGVVGVQQQPAVAGLEQFQPPVARDVLADVDAHVFRQVVLSRTRPVRRSSTRRSRRPRPRSRARAA